MRDIKFRAWYSDHEQYVYFSGIFNERPIVNEEIRYVGTTLTRTKSYGAVTAIEQYTGLKDKNGKEIYEGDIVEITYERWRKYHVEYWGKDWASFVLVKDGQHYEAQLSDYSDIEVVGNIHESKGDV